VDDGFVDQTEARSGLVIPSITGRRLTSRMIEGLDSDPPCR
jgi:hypothetical protein